MRVKKFLSFIFTILINLVFSFFLNCSNSFAQDTEELKSLLFKENAGEVRLTAGWNVKNCSIWGGILADCRHTGIDLASPMGTPVYSATDGVVIRVAHGKDCPYMECLSTVAIYHEPTNLTFIYLHMRNIRVKEGDKIEAGKPIGEVGMRGVGRGPHLHFEVRPGMAKFAAVDVKKTINPLDGIKKVKVILEISKLLQKYEKCFLTCGHCESEYTCTRLREDCKTIIKIIELLVKNFKGLIDKKTKTITFKINALFMGLPVKEFTWGICCDPEGKTDWPCTEEELIAPSCGWGFVAFTVDKDFETARKFLKQKYGIDFSVELRDKDTEVTLRPVLWKEKNKTYLSCDSGGL